MSGSPSPEDQCLAELNALADSKDADALVMAEASVAHYLAALDASPQAAVLALGALQARFIQKAGSSKMRADILDAIGERVAGLLDGEAPAS